MAEPSPFPLEPTADGSYTFFSPEFGEWFHSREGAYGEAERTYCGATDLVNRAQAQGCLTLLDVCYGLGYNSAAAIAALAPLDLPLHLVGLELDGRVPQAAIAQGLLAPWPPLVQTALTHLAQGTPTPAPLRGHLHLGDARQTLPALLATGFQADVIFLDPFSPPHCPQLWTVEFLALVAQALKPTGILATYSCAAAVRAALQAAGLTIGASAAAGRRWPGTVANWGDRPLPPLSIQEQEHLATRAAVPYRDPTLGDDAATIQARRHQEQLTSTLQSTGAWRRRWLSSKSPEDLRG